MICPLYKQAIISAGLDIKDYFPADFECDKGKCQIYWICKNPDDKEKEDKYDMGN